MLPIKDIVKDLKKWVAYCMAYLKYVYLCAEMRVSVAKLNILRIYILKSSDIYTATVTLRKSAFSLHRVQVVM
jgi:hypothetical protein